MSGITPHGIRYPDGASKVKDFGPEMKILAEDLDDLVWNGTGAIAEEIVRQEVEVQLSESQTVIDAAEAAVDNAVAGRQLAPVKCVYLDGGKWVWDDPPRTLSTHYVIPDDTGALVVRPTVWPTPGVTPVLDW